MAFCTRCGSESPETDAFCGKCGAPRAAGTIQAQAAEVGATPTDRVALIALEKEHRKLIARAAVAGGFVWIISTIVLLVIADEMPREIGGAFLVLISLASAAFFVALLFPRFASSVNERAASKQTIDPATGKPLRMVWWFRWLAAMVALTTFIGAGDYFSPPTTDKPAAVAPAPAVASAPLSESDFNARLAKEKEAQAAETKAPITAMEREHGIDALCEATMQQVREVARGEKNAEDASPFIMVAAAYKILMDRYGDSEYRAAAIIDAANRDMQAKDPSGTNGNLIEYCTRRAGG